MKKILLHICCGPCSTAPILDLKKEFEVEGFFYNPNIFPDEEKEKRREGAEVVAEKYGIDLEKENDTYDYYLRKIKGKEKNIDNERCRECYRLRLAKTAKKAKGLKIKTFSTTLLISPYQNIEDIKQIGNEIARQNGLEFYFKDFRTLFKQSRELSRELNLYRQKYCGCSFSRQETVGRDQEGVL